MDGSGSARYVHQRRRPGRCARACRRSRPTTTRCSVRNGGVCAASTSASSGSRPSSSVGGGDLDLLDHERALLVADELVDELAHRVAQHDLVVAAEQRDSRRHRRAHPVAARRGRRGRRPGRRPCGARRARRGPAGCGSRGRCPARGRRGWPRADRRPRCRRGARGTACSTPTGTPASRARRAGRGRGAARGDCGSVLPRSRPASTMTRSRGMPAASACSARSREEPAHGVRRPARRRPAPGRAPAGPGGCGWRPPTRRPPTRDRRGSRGRRSR